MTEDTKHLLDELAVTDMLSYLGARVSSMEEQIRKSRFKWHDLQKDPTDLPNHGRFVWTNAGAGYYDGDDNDNVNRGWWDSFGRLYGVVAWCEPKFKEVTK